MTVPRDDVRLLSAGDEVIAERFLLTRPETTMILRSNLARAGLAKEGRTYQGTYAGAIDGDALDGLAALYWNDNLVLAGGQHVVALTETLAARAPRGLRGLLGTAIEVAEARRMADGRFGAPIRRQNHENPDPLNLANASRGASRLAEHLRDERRLQPADSPPV